MKKGRKYGIVIAIAILLLIGLLLLLWVFFRNKPDPSGEKQVGSAYHAGFVKYYHEEMMTTWEDLENSKYDSLLLTSYRCRQFNRDALTWGFGVETFQIVWKTGSVHEVKAALEKAFESSDDIHMVFLELDPKRHNDPALIEWIRAQKDTHFFIFFGPYPVDYWKMLEEAKGLEERFSVYSELAQKLQKLENVSLFYFDNQEWMVNNPYFFADSMQISRDGIFQIYSAFGSGNCMLTKESMSQKPEKFLPVTKESKYADFSGQIIFCFGDSMLGKDRNESGAAEIAAGLLHAQVYNAAVSGSSASGKEIHDLTGMVDILLNWEQEKEKLTTEAYQEQIPRDVAAVLENMQNVMPDYIILAYGYNDYSAGAFPYEGEDGQVSFMDALCGNIDRLKAAYPQAGIIVSTAVTSSTELDREYPLRLYADAAQAAAQKEQVSCLYNYETDQLIRSNLENILVDGVHFNVAGRFLQGCRIAALLEEIGQPVAAENE